MRKKRTTNTYWDQSLDDVFVEYAKVSPKKRNTLYDEQLKAPLEKLTEYVFNTYKFPYIQEHPKDAQHDCLVHLINHAGYYDKEKGRSFSYFSFIAKNHYIQLNTRAYEKIKKHVPFNTVAPERNEPEENSTFKAISDKCLEKHERDERLENLNGFYDYVIQYFKENFDSIFVKPMWKEVGVALITVLEEGKTDTFGSKRDIWARMHEMSGKKTQQITRVIYIAKSHFQILKEHWVNGVELQKVPRHNSMVVWKNWKQWKSVIKKKSRQKKKMMKNTQ